jgi:hypothetical protein
MIKFEIGGQYLVLKEDTRINFILENPFFDIDYVINSPFTFNFNVPNDENGINRQIFNNQNRITTRNGINLFDCWIYIANNKWIFGNISIKFSNDNFECYFNQYLDEIDTNLEKSITEIPTDTSITHTLLYTAIKDRIEDGYAGPLDFVHYPVYNPDLLGSIDYIRPAPAFDNMFYNQYGHYVNYWFSDVNMPYAGIDHFVNQYFLVIDKSLAYQGWTFQYAMSPAIYLPFLFNKLFDYWGILLKTDFFDDVDIQKLTVWTNKTYIMEIWSDALTPSFNPQKIFFTKGGTAETKFYLDDYLPDITWKQFLLSVKKTFCLVYLWDFGKKQLKIVKANDFITSNSRVNWSNKTQKSFELEIQNPNGYTLKTNYSDDQYLTTFIQQISKNAIYELPVTTYSNLPTPTTKPGTVCLVLDEQAYYIITGVGTGQKWELLTQNYIDKIISDGKTEISNDCDTLLRLFNAEDDLRRDIYGDYELYDNTVTYITGARVWYENERYESLQDDNISNQPDITPLYWDLMATTFSQAHWTIPEYSEENDSGLNALADKSENLRLLFYRGLQEYNSYIKGAEGGDDNTAAYPYATHTEIDPVGNKIGDYSLAWDGDYGLYQQHWKKYLDFLTNAKKVIRKINLNIDDLLNLDWTKKVIITDHEAGGTSEYFIKKISVNISLKGIETSEVELYTI